MNEEMMIPDSIYDHYTQISNQITVLNAQMAMMERDGREDTTEYEELSKIEWQLCMTRMNIRRRIAKKDW